ncbi:MAG TPA: glycoside hydrolase family 16 protein [Flavitalea sp.]|nr:glycoside hydrolase family 16 protein [Flavitalea sp.]
MNILRGFPVFPFLFTLLVCHTHSFSQKKVPGVAVPGKTIFFDDFNEDQLNRKNWNVVKTGNVVNNEQQAYVDSSLVLTLVKGEAAQGAENGALRIKPKYTQGFRSTKNASFDFISGRINTKGKVEFSYGRAEARIRITDGKGFWPAWWLLGGGDWPATGEIDIMEYIGENWTNAALHGQGYSGNTPFVKRVPVGADSSVNNWHVYAVDWTAEEIDFSVDGKSFYKVSKSEIEKYGKWAYDSPKHLILNFAPGGSYPAGVNKVTSPYPGLPEASVELIKTGKCQMLVDWVKITANP